MDEVNTTRMGFIGGSDMSAIMSGDWEHLWQIKTGRMQPDDLSNVFAVQLGIATEEFNMTLVEQHTGTTFDRQKRFTMVFDEDIYLRATLDGWADNTGVECKHTYERNNLNTQLDRYMPQIQFYLWVSKSDHMYFANIFGNRDWKMCKVNRDQAYIEAMKQPLRNFWQFVKNDQQPLLPHYPVMQPKIDSIAIDDMTSRCVNGDNEFHDRAMTFIETKDAHTLHESAKKDLKQMIGHDEREIYSDTLAVRRTKSGLRIVQKKEV